MMFPRSFAPMITLASCWAVGFFPGVDNVTAGETAVRTTVDDVLYWAWNKGDVYDVQMQTKTSIHLKQGQQDLNLYLWGCTAMQELSTTIRHYTC